MAFLDTITGESLSSQTELFRRQRERTETARSTLLDSRKALTTDKSSTQRVAALGKSQAANFVGGGATVYNAEVNPTDFIPDPNQDPEKSLPDYYRNGRQVLQTRVIDGEIFTTQEYSPVPELVGERGSPVLASIRLVNTNKLKDSGPSTSVNSEALLIPSYSKFFLEGVREAHTEKFQTVETFNDWYVYFYGEQPPIYQFSGHLLNFNNYNWKNEFMYFYRNFWRGTKCVELGAKIYLTYDYQQVQGYILNVSTDLQALTDKAAPFNISMIITKILIFNGTTTDSVVRDNLIPRTNTGLVNLEANSFSTALATEFLNGQSRPPVSLDTATADNSGRGIRLISDNAPSTIQQVIPSVGGINPFSTNSVGGQRASFFTKNLGLG